MNLQSQSSVHSFLALPLYSVENLTTYAGMMLPTVRGDHHHYLALDW